MRFIRDRFFQGCYLSGGSWHLIGRLHDGGATLLQPDVSIFLDPQGQELANWRTGGMINR